MRWQNKTVVAFGIRSRLLTAPRSREKERREALEASPAAVIYTTAQDTNLLRKTKCGCEFTTLWQIPGGVDAGVLSSRDPEQDSDLSEPRRPHLRTEAPSS